MASASDKPASKPAPAGDPAPIVLFADMLGEAVADVSDRLAGAFVQIETVQELLRTAETEIARREKEISSGSALFERHVEALARRGRKLRRVLKKLKERRAAMDLLREAMDHEHREMEAARQTFEAQRIAANEAQAAAAKLENEARAWLAEIDTSRADIAQREAAVASERARIDEEQQQLRLQLQDVEAQRTAIEERAREVESAEKLLVRRQEAVARFQQVFSEMSSTLGMPNMMALASEATGAALPAGPPTQSAAAPKPPVADAASKRPSAPSSAAEVVARFVAAEPLAANGDSSTLPPPKAAAHEPELGGPNDGAGAASRASAAPAADATQAILPNGAVDESRLDPDTLHRLRVLRRLTGGAKSDAVLIERIRLERGEIEVPAGAVPKKKSRWWGG